MMHEWWENSMKKQSAGLYRKGTPWQKKDQDRVRPRKTMRIVYGTGKHRLYWTVRVSDAKKDVVVNGSLMDALRGTPGETIGCHLSNCAVRNASSFPHECHLASFTRHTCAIVDKISNGAPSHAVRYMHNYGDLVDLNDTDKEKKKIRENPKLAEASYILKAPRGLVMLGSSHTVKGVSHKPAGKIDHSRTHLVPRGALLRARRAGLVTADLANAISPRTAVL